MNDQKRFIGIDMSKRSFEVAGVNWNLHHYVTVTRIL